MALIQTKAAPSSIDDGAALQQIDPTDLQKLAQAQEKLRTLGPCPRPMMG